MREADLVDIISTLNVKPYKMCASLMHWGRRSRYHFLEGFSFDNSEDFVCAEKELYHSVTMSKQSPYRRPPASAWLDQGATWAGEDYGHLHPTLTRLIPASRQPSHPNGIETCGGDELQVWRDHQ